MVEEQKEIEVVGISYDEGLFEASPPSQPYENLFKMPNSLPSRMIKLQR